MRYPERARTTVSIQLIDWDVSEGSRVPISAQVEFEIATFRRSAKGMTENRRQYRIIRSTYETLSGIKWERSPSTVKLFLLTDTGSESAVKKRV